MSRSAKQVEVFGRTHRAVNATRRKMLTFLRDKGVLFSNAPSNVELHGVAVQNGWHNGLKKTLRGKRKVDCDFYASKPWRMLRYEALRANDGKCELCGAGKHNGATLHVDHIKPRSKFPELELVLGNLQVLCEDCNIGKSNKDATDWRRAPQSQAMEG